MRRLMIGLAALAIPAASLAAQIGQVGMPTTRGTPPDREKPPMGRGIHDARLYNRYKLTRFSVESSPMLAYMQTTGMIAEGISGNYWGFGDATVITFRTVPSLYLTTAFTATALGGPVGMNSSEVGLRFQPWTSPRVAPFAEARMSWAFTSSFPMASVSVPLALGYRFAYNDFASGSGRGMVYGIGADTRISARYSVMTALTYASYDMEGRNLSARTEWGYRNDASRLLIGLRYNHGAWFE